MTTWFNLQKQGTSMGAELPSMTSQATRGTKRGHDTEQMKTEIAHSASRCPPAQSHAPYGSQPNILNVNQASTDVHNLTREQGLKLVSRIIV